jgi:nucleoside-diphosphate-sugar epimerase
MNLLITGANGFIGKALLARLLTADAPFGPDARLTALDLAFEGPEHPRVRRLTGSIADPALVARAFDVPVDVVFHLASVPGGAAEQNYELGRRVNLDGMLLLLEAARAGPRPPVFVFASSIAVLGAPLPAMVDDATVPHPRLSYGAQKLIGEVLVEDFSRRAWIDGRAVRLPGIVARPPQRTGHLSAFMSDIIRELAAGRAYACPVGAEATAWLMSTPCIVDNLLHAAWLPAAGCTDLRTWTLPALRCSMAQLAEATGEAYGTPALSLVSWHASPELEASFGRYPPLRTPAADAAGFRHDGALTTLVRCALAPTEPIRQA